MKWEISDKVANWIFAVILAITTYFCFYRLGYYSLWGDETWVATSALSSISDTFSFSYFPGNPFFIILVKGATTLFGKSEFTFRFIPALFYVLSVLVFYLLLKIITNKNYVVTLIATALFAFNPTLIWFSHDLKQYTLEIFFTLFLFYLAERYIAEKTNRNFWILTVSSILSVLFSFPSVFVIPAVVLRLMVDEYSKGDGIFSNHYLTKIKKIVIYTVLTAGTFLIYYFTVIRQRTLEERHISYWTESWTCLPEQYNLHYVINFIYDASFSFIQYLFYYSGFGTFQYKIIFVIFWIGAFYVLYKKEKSILIYAFVPGVLTIVASIARKYPFCGSRVDLFIMPFIFVFIAYAFYCLVLIFTFNEKITRILVMTILILGSIGIIMEFGQETLSSGQVKMNVVSQFYRDNFKVGEDLILLVSPWTYYPAYFEEQPFVNNISRFEYSRVESIPWVNLMSYQNSTTYNIFSNIPIDQRINDVIDKATGLRLWVFFEVNDDQEKLNRYARFSKIFEKRCNLLASKEDFGVILDLYQC